MKRFVHIVLFFGIVFLSAGNWAAEGDDSWELNDEQRALLKTVETDVDPVKRRDAVLVLAEDLLYRAIGPLVSDTIIDDKDESVRAMAIDVMLARESNTAEISLAVWVKALHDKSPRVRARAAAAIYVMFAGDEEGESPYWRKSQELVEAEVGDRDPIVRGLIALAVGKSSDDRKAVLSVLLAALKQEDAAPLPEGIWGRTIFDQWALKCFGDVGPDAAWAVPSLIERLKIMKSPGSNDMRADSDSRTVAATVDAITRIGPNAVPKLVAALKSKHGTPRTVAALALVEMNQERAQAVPPLIQSLHGECGGLCCYSHIRRFDVCALATCGHEAVPLLLEASKDEKTNKLVCEALSLMGGDAEVVLPQLSKALSDQDVAIRRTVAVAMGRFQPTAEQAVPALLRATDDDDADVARLASASLASIYLEKIDSDYDLHLISGLTKLEELDLSRKNITDAGLRHLGALKSLRGLSLPKAITDRGIDYLKSLKNLKQLDLRDTKITDAGFKALAESANLEQLDLSGTQITNASLQYISGMKSLESLQLSNVSGITDDSLLHLRDLTKLKKLCLWHTKVTDAGLIHLAGMKDLEYLSLSNHITDDGLDRLKDFKKLTYLNLGNSVVSKQKVHVLEKELPKCRIWYKVQKNTPGN